ncbi:MAG: hypothetical protein KJP00_03290 [Bacteroidia bacterium]|nr:hypothetical protein [Bacteroidia bacterium]
MLLSIGVVSADDLRKQEFTKKISKEYTINKDGKVELSNKYGKIDVKTNNSNMVVIDIEIRVDAKNEDVANDAFERVKIDFMSNSDYVKASTSLESQKGWNNWWGNKNYNLQINYEVSLPKTVELDVSNKYGDVYVTDLENDLDLEVKYGKFYVNSAYDIQLEAKYGSGDIESCKNIVADLGYVSGSGLSIEKCDKAEIDSKYSKINIKSAESIRSDAGYDNFNIGKVEDFRLEGNYNKIEIEDIVNLNVDSRYTNIAVEDFRGYADIEMGYGGLDIYTVHAGFKGINVDSNYGAVKLRMSTDASYAVDITTDYAGIEYPDNLDIKIRDYGNKTKMLEGTFGSNPTGTIKIVSDYGSVKIR